MNTPAVPTGFKEVTAYLFKQVDWRIMVVPPVVAFAIGYAVVQGYYLHKKPIMEFIGLAVSTYFFLICLLRYRLDKQTFRLGCVWISFAFWSREIHYPGSDILVYGSILLLAYWVVTRFDFFKPYIDSQPYFSLFAAAFLSYFISQTTDQRWWRFVPYEDVVHVRLEETMEIVGHLFLGTALILWQRVQPE